MKLAKLGDGPEIFHTLQGEGLSCGVPAVFIRASRCNLHCIWCDTDHTWNFEKTPWPHEKDALPGYAKHQKSEVTFEIDPTAVAQLILAYQCPRTIITGGEPLLQQAEFLQMIHTLRAHQPEHQFEVETNGTQIPSPDFHQAIDQFNVSPKLTNAAMPESLRLHPQALEFFARSHKSWFKFVVASPADLDEVHALATTYSLAKQRIILMPEGRTTEELDQSAPWLAEVCRDLGYRFSDRLHIRLWGDKRGV